MQLITQINDTNPSEGSNVARKLTELDVTVTNQHLEEFMVAPLQDVWERYEMTVELLGAIGRSSFHTVVNSNNLVTREMSVQMLQAIRHNRPILMSNLPDFADDVPTYTRQLITSKLHKFTFCDLARTDATKLRIILRRLPRPTDVDYQLDIRDSILIRAHIGAYLRDVVSKTHSAAANTSAQLQIA